MQVTVSQEIGLTPDEVKAWQLFAEWASRQNPDSKVKIAAAEINEGSRQIYRLQVVQDTPDKQWIQHFLMCGPTVDVLTVLSDGHRNRCLIFVEQFREAVGERVISNPAGFIDEGERPEDGHR